MISCPEHLRAPPKEQLEHLLERVKRFPMPIKAWRVKALSEEEKSKILPYISKPELVKDAELWIFITLSPEHLVDPLKNANISWDKWSMLLGERLSGLSEKELLCHLEKYTMMAVGMAMLEAGSHGMTACPVLMYDEEKISQELGLSDKITAIIAFGEGTLEIILDEVML